MTKSLSFNIKEKEMLLSLNPRLSLTTKEGEKKDTGRDLLLSPQSKPGPASLNLKHPVKKMEEKKSEGRRKGKGGINNEAKGMTCGAGGCGRMRFL